MRNQPCILVIPHIVKPRARSARICDYKFPIIFGVIAILIWDRHSYKIYLLFRFWFVLTLLNFIRFELYRHTGETKKDNQTVIHSLATSHIAILNYLKEASTTLSYRYKLAERASYRYKLAERNSFGISWLSVPAIGISWLSVVEANILTNHLGLL